MSYFRFGHERSKLPLHAPKSAGAAMEGDAVTGLAALMTMNNDDMGLALIPEKRPRLPQALGLVGVTKHCSSCRKTKPVDEFNGTCAPPYGESSVSRTQDRCFQAKPPAMCAAP